MLENYNYLKIMNQNILNLGLKMIEKNEYGISLIDEYQIYFIR